MFQKGDYVVYGTNGPCLVEDVTRLNIPGSDRKRKYYVLQPIDSQTSTIYSPVDNEKVKIRGIISRETAEELLHDIDEISEAEINSEKFREEEFKEILKSGDCRRVIGLIKKLMSKRVERLAQGRKFTSVDERYLDDSLGKVAREIALALGKDYDATRSYLVKTIEVACEQ